MTSKFPSGIFISGKSGKVAAQIRQVKGAEDFELITWLIKKEGG